MPYKRMRFNRQRMYGLRRVTCDLDSNKIAIIAALA